MTPGEKLDERRKAAGMSQAALAAALGTTENTVRRLETGRMDIDARWRSHLALYFKSVEATLAYALERNGP